MRFLLGAQPSPKTTHNVAEKKLCFKHTAGDDQNQYVRIAAEISNNDLDFLATLDMENALWQPDRQSNVVQSNGIREDSWGFCQFHRPTWGNIVGDSRFFTNPRWQLEQCWEHYKGGTRFYGYDVRHLAQKHFTCP